MSNASKDKSAAKSIAKTLAAWQPPLLEDDKKKGKSKTKTCSMSDFDASAKPFSPDDSKQDDKTAVEALAVELDALQNLFYADRRFKLLVVLQGTDTSGKDGTLRGVFNRMSPLGLHTAAWKAPTENELARDYLWRIHQMVPPAGEFMIFNRSHYEDVLVPSVKGWITADQTQERFAQINDFERMLTETGTVVVKFLLHISFEEQRERLQERIADISKNWKFSLGDLDDRKLWPKYQQAYTDILNATSTRWAPWTVVPANSKTHRNLMIATVLRERLQELGLRYPPANPALKGLKVT